MSNAAEASPFRARRSHKRAASSRTPTDFSVSAVAATSPIVVGEEVMGTGAILKTLDGFSEDAWQTVMGVLREADRVFSLWKPDSPMSRLRDGRASISDLDDVDADLIREVLDRCELARDLTGGVFDPWEMPGGLDPNALVKGWATHRALRASGLGHAQLDVGGDIAVSSGSWHIGIQDPAQPDPNSRIAAVEVSGAIATSGDYCRPGHLVDVRTGATARGAVSATVTGPELDLADALSTALFVDHRKVLGRVEMLAGYEGFVVDTDGRWYATDGFPFVLAS